VTRTVTLMPVLLLKTVDVAMTAAILVAAVWSWVQEGWGVGLMVLGLGVTVRVLVRTLLGIP